MTIKNAENYEQCFSADDLYFFAVGCDHRSCFLIEKLLQMYPANRPIVFALDDYEKCPDSGKIVEDLKTHEIIVYKEGYSSSNEVHTRIVDSVRLFIEQHDTATIHIDYSSMPRSWYCKLPSLLEGILREKDKVYFWYSEGEYPASYEEYPSAGIESFSFFSGKPSLQIERNRIHVIALGYDVIRTQAILSIVDPNYLVTCYAYNPNRKGFFENLRQVNNPILARSAMSVALHIDDFEFMISKLCDISNELLPAGDVVLIPDGPKPLIFALSLIPGIVGKRGLVCLHISRNQNFCEAIDVTPTEKVFGFYVTSNRVPM